MRIIILNQFFYPDHSATSQLMSDLAESLVERGVEVTALCGRGRYNGGEPLPHREIYRGVVIERAWATNYGKGSIARRISDYLSFYVGASWKLWRLPRHDVVMALTTPPLIGLIAFLIGRLRRMRTIALVQDVYPDVAVALGTLRGESVTTKFFDRINRLILRKADRIVVLGECMRELIADKVGVGAGERIDVIHNWADGSQIKPLGDEHNPFVASHQLEGKFVVLFSGNLGRVNEFATVLEAARQLQSARPEVVFIFIGEGAKASEIKNYISLHKLDNIRLLPYQPREALRYSLAAGHISLVTLAPGLAGLSVPSKTYGILAAARPILFIGDQHSDVARLILENHCGATIATGDVDELVRLIIELTNDSTKLATLGFAARALFEKSFDRPQAVESYLHTIKCCLDSSSNGSHQHSAAQPALGAASPNSQQGAAES